MKGDKFLVVSHGEVHIQRSNSGWSYCTKWNAGFNTDAIQKHHKTCVECLEKQEKETKTYE
jgi:hypothetical protein